MGFEFKNTDGEIIPNEGITNMPNEGIKLNPQAMQSYKDLIVEQLAEINDLKHENMMLKETLQNIYNEAKK